MHANAQRDGCYNPAVPLASVSILVALTVWPASVPPPQESRAESIRTEFRVFDGTTEVSADTRLRVRPAGSTETGRLVEGQPLAADLPPGLYDVQAVRQQSGQVINVRWAEKLMVMAYPDEGGRHLEVINFASEHGALQLRWAEGMAPDPAGVGVTVTREGEGRPSPARTLHGLGYALLVVPAGTYDVRVTIPGRDPYILSSIEVPADRTRMKVIR